MVRRTGKAVGWLNLKNFHFFEQSYRTVPT